MRRLLVVLLALSLPPSTRLSAQSPEDRATIAALRDSLAGVTDSLSLRHLEAATIQVAKQQRDDPLIHCRLGFIAYRLGELTNAKSHYDDAAGELRWAGELPADSAVAGFQAYLGAGGDSGLGLLELARTYYYAQRPADGWRTYFAGARLARSPAAVALYRADLSVVAGPDELAPFDGFTSPGPRAAWLERFWLRRDITEAREPGERLAEHYRRWFYAWHNFRLVSRHRHYDITERYRADQTTFDDRGAIYLRHGSPDKRATYPRVLDRLEIGRASCRERV